MTDTLDFHPLSNAYRLMEGEEFDELVADIGDNGLLEPIVIHEGLILDGRNRYRACLEAGVEPEYVEWSGEAGSPEAFVLAKHTRRNVTKGQHAMAAARLYPDGGGGRGNKDPARKSAVTADFSQRHLQRARAVLRDAPDLADAVTAGATPLTAAYEEARERRERAESEQARLTRLAERHPGLAEQVETGDLTLAGAESDAKERDRQENERRASIVTAAVSAVRQLLPFANEEFVARAMGYVEDDGFHSVFAKNLREEARWDGDLESVTEGCAGLIGVLERMEGS